MHVNNPGIGENGVNDAQIIGVEGRLVDDAKRVAGVLMLATPLLLPRRAPQHERENGTAFGKAREVRPKS